jgi:hypothetical protein
VARLSAEATAEAVFVCVTAPLSPGLSTRTETLRLSGSFWAAVADAPAVCPPAFARGSARPPNVAEFAGPCSSA